MADHKTEKYHRINLFLDKGFIILAREVVQKHVVNSTPPCYNQNPWRLEDFLFHNQRAIFRYPNGKPRNLLEGQKLLLIPTPPNKPNLEHWDITLLCFVLTELCQISKPDKDDIIVIQKIRNEICHTTDASLSDREYADYSKTIKGVIGRFLVWLNDANITQEINDIMKDIEDGPLTHLQELLRQVEEWQNSERALATAVNNLSLVTTTGFAEQDKKYDKLIEKMQTLIDLKCRNLQPPDTKINMRVINCENEDYLCDKLVAILKSENQTDDQLERPLKNAMSKLIKEEMKIISVKKECVAIVLRCRSFESLHRLWTTCVNGEATILFKPVEQCLRHLPGCKNVEFKVGVTTEELFRCVETMVSEIEEDTVRQEPTCTVTVMHSLQEKKLHSLPKSEHTTFALPKIVESGPQPGKEGIVIKIIIKPTTFEHVMHTLESFESTEFTKELQSISSMLQKKLKIADVDVKATLDNETELKEALVSNLYMLNFGAALQSTKSSEKCLIHDGELMNMFGQTDRIIGCHKCMEQEYGGVVGNIKGAKETIVSKSREFAHFIKNKFGYVDNTSSLTMMGGSSSVQRDDNLLPRPWRITVGFTKLNTIENLNILKNEIGELKPYDESIQINIAILGKLQAGKSSFINTVLTAFPDHASLPAYVDPADSSVTSRYTQYKVNDNTCSYFRLCDTRGIAKDFGVGLLDFKNLVEGHISDNYTFDEKRQITKNDESYIKHPKFNDKMHCVCFVLDASKLTSTPDSEYKSVKDFLKMIGQTYNVPFVVLLTHLDQVCHTVRLRPDWIYKSREVLRTVQLVSRKLEISDWHTVPVVNYTNETEDSQPFSFLALLALRQMLRQCKDYYDEHGPTVE